MNKTLKFLRVLDQRRLYATHHNVIEEFVNILKLYLIECPQILQNFSPDSVGLADFSTYVY